MLPQRPWKLFFLIGGESMLIFSFEMRAMLKSTWCHRRFAITPPSIKYLSSKLEFNCFPKIALQMDKVPWTTWYYQVDSFSDLICRRKRLLRHLVLGGGSWSHLLGHEIHLFMPLKKVSRIAQSSKILSCHWWLIRWRYGAGRAAKNRLALQLSLRRNFSFAARKNVEALIHSTNGRQRRTNSASFPPHDLYACLFIFHLLWRDLILQPKKS